MGKPGKSHSYRYRLQFELQDAAEDSLFVDVNEHVRSFLVWLLVVQWSFELTGFPLWQSRPLEGLPPVDLRKNADVCAEVRRRLRSYVGNTFEPNLQR